MSRKHRFAVPLVAVVLLASCGGSTSARVAHHPISTTTTTRRVVTLPYVPVANDAACPADAATIKLAEQSYALLNGSFATMAQLVTAKFLRTASKYFVTVEVGKPAGGYTLIGGPVCGNLPVTG
jgi:hypothetical protein